jgi:cell division protein FtsQ
VPAEKGALAAADPGHGADPGPARGARRGAGAGGRGGGKGGGKGGGGKGRGGRGGGGRGGVVVDPRMRARRIRVRRETGQRRLRRFALGLAALALVVGAAAATRSPLLDVDRVEVTGTDRTSVEAVLRAVAVERGEPLLSVDLGAASRRVEELPWVDHATVARRWPSTVEVQVSEREPAALAQVTGAHVALVDAEGRVLAIERWPGDAPEQEDAGIAGGPGEGGAPEGGAAAGEGASTGPAALAVLTGVEGPLVEGGTLEGDAGEALRVAVAVTERMPGAVTSVSTELEAELADGGIIRFGDAGKLDAKVTAAKTVLDQVDLSCLAVLDVRVPGSPALTRHQGCS